ncbi:MAG: hypothetical protein QM665_05720 [Desulfovibrio sp.]
MTQETTLEDSMRNDTVRSMQSLSPSVSPAGNGCREATDASSVVTQETTLEDSTCDDTVTSLQSLSPSVGPSGNGCREDSNAYGT